jgi:FkbM family methyltransferase
MRLSRWLAKFRVAVGFECLCHPVVGKVIHKWFHGAIPFRGHCFELETDGRVPYQQAASLFWGLYEKSERRLISQCLRPDLDVIELGSGAGVISCFILRAQMPEKSLTCVEANPAAVKMLLQNVRRNYPSREFVRVVNGAVDYSGAEAVSFQIHESLIGSNLGQVGSNSARIPAVTLSQIHEHFGLKRFALVCDIEGAEAGLLENERSALEFCEQIIIELHTTSFNDRTYSISDLSKLIENMGFALRASRRNVFVYERMCSQGNFFRSGLVKACAPPKLPRI